MAKEKQNPMRYYDLWRNPPAEAKKAFNNGKYKGTDINAMWRIQVLTEQFGPCGIGWYYTIERQWSETLLNGNVFTYCNVSLYIKVDGEWSKPIQGTGGNFEVKQVNGGTSLSDECHKMALTDALSIACKALGIGADVWFEKGQSKYTLADEDCEFVPEPQAAPVPKQTPAASAEPAQETTQDAMSELNAKIAEAEKVIAAMKTPEEVFAYVTKNGGGFFLMPVNAQADATQDEIASRNDFREYALNIYNEKKRT